jgi:hypothetical protein
MRTHARIAGVLGLVLSVLLLPAGTAARTPAGARKSNNTTGETVHVRTYTRKDGTVVRGYYRTPPLTATSHNAGRGGAATGRAFGAHGMLEAEQRGFIAPAYKLDSIITRDSDGRIHRSKAAKAAFQRDHPCPANGSTRGGCPGYVIDHVAPLECGGPDAPFNMQWQTIADGKAKDKTERFCR